MFKYNDYFLAIVIITDLVCALFALKPFGYVDIYMLSVAFFVAFCILHIQYGAVYFAHTVRAVYFAHIDYSSLCLCSFSD